MSVEVLVAENIFKSSAQTLVNAVNTVGVMGKGLAKKFADRFPEMLADYEGRCAEKSFMIGRPYIYKGGRPWIVNFPTKEHWRAGSDLAPILDGITFLGQHLHEWGVESLAVPSLGCGQGGLEWRVVGPVYVRRFDAFGIPVYLYAPFADAAVTGTSGALTLFEEPGDTPPRSMVPLTWVALAACLNGRSEAAVSRTQLAAMGRLAMLEGLDTGLLPDQEDRFGLRGFASTVQRLRSNGLLVEERHGRHIVYAPGPAAIARATESVQTRQAVERIVAQVLDRPSSL